MMLVSLRHRLVILAMPKCASTSIEAALAGQADVVINRHPRAKHTPFRKYDRFLRRYFETFTDGPLEVVSMFREPEDWLQSWWRYRGRDGLIDPARSTRGWSFAQFVEAYLSGRPGPASVGGQAQFVSARDGSMGCDRVFRYDRLDRFAIWLSDRMQTEVALDHLNLSPPASASTMLDADIRSALAEGLQREYQIYRDIAE